MVIPGLDAAQEPAPSGPKELNIFAAFHSAF